MKIATGTVLQGQIVVEGQPSFAEGEKVTILSHSKDVPFEVTPEERRLLLESMAQADRGELADMDELLEELDEPA